MKIYGLIGYPLSHSFSATYFNDKFHIEKIEGCLYLNFPIETIEELTQLLSEYNDLKGLNVTIPYKEQVIKYIDKIDDTARSIGAVNTIKIKRIKDSIKLSGYNTDAYGFEQSILPHLKDTHKKALILGTGGASKAIAYVFDRLQIEYIFVSRNPRMDNHISYPSLNNRLMDECRIIVNTSPVGTYPDVDRCPYIPYEYITGNHLVYDLIYNPEISKLLKKASERGAKVLNGLLMLHLQAEKAWEIWNGDSYS
jgi:shikimate dehydrogenase